MSKVVQGSPAKQEETQQIYLVVTQSGSALSALLKRVTGAKYNHVSVSLRRDLALMYSFGRRRPYNPFWGGFVQESASFGTFKRFSETEAVVVRLSVTPAQYRAIQDCLREMFRRRLEYGYNYVGLFLAAFHIRARFPNRYYCSEFVKELLLRFQVIAENETSPITEPIHFLHLKNGEKIYEGKLRLYQ